MTPSAVRIAFLTWRDTTHPDGGGSEVFVERVAAELAGRGHDVTLVCAAHPGAAPAETLDGVRLRRRGGRLTVYPRALAWAWWHRRRLDVVVDVVNGLPFGTPVVRRRGVVALVHHSHREQWRIIYPGLAGRVGWFVERRLVPLLYRGRPHLTVSESSRRDLVAHGVRPGDIAVVPGGVDAAPSAEPRSDSPRLVVLARLVPHKRVEHAVDVVERLLPTCPDLVLDVVGEGWWRAQVEADLARRDPPVRAAVRLHGHLPARQRDAVLARAWVLLLPSVKEGWGLAVTEAAVQGTPAVAYRDAGGVAESVLDGRTGLLAREREGSAGLAEATATLLADAELRAALGRAAAARARELTWRRTADAVETVLRSAASTAERRQDSSP